MQVVHFLRGQGLSPCCWNGVVNSLRRYTHTVPRIDGGHPASGPRRSFAALVLVFWFLVALGAWRRPNGQSAA